MTGAIDACILAGGRATRLGGRNKPALAKDGASILERQLEVLAPRVRTVWIAIARGAAPLPVPARRAAQVRFVEDAEAGAGPLAGLAAALAAGDATWVLVTAGDLPHLAGGLVDLLIGAIAEDADAVVPRLRGLPEPLLALYRRAPAQAGAAARLASGRRKVAALLDDLRVRWIEEAALRAVDPALRSFDDVDTPDDLERWRAH